MKHFFDLGGGFILTGGISGLGVLARIILFCYYGFLGHACMRLNGTKNKTVAYIREDLRKHLEKGRGIQSAAVYTEKCMAQRRFAGIRMDTWEAIGMQTVLLVAVSGAVCAIGGILCGCEEKQVLEMLFVAGSSTGLLLVLDLFFGIREKHRRTRLFLREQIENVWLPDNGAELPEAEDRAVHNRRKKEDSREKKKKAVKQKRLENASEGKRKKAAGRHGKAQEEKRRLTEELLRERRQLEARQLAEAKRNETARQEQWRETDRQLAEAELKQSFAEAAVTNNAETIVRPVEKAEETQMEKNAEELSYEELLKNVLSEYLA